MKYGFLRLLEVKMCCCFFRNERSSDTLNLKLPTEMAEIKVAKKTIFLSRKDSWSSPQIISQGHFHFGQVLIDK